MRFIPTLFSSLTVIGLVAAHSAANAQQALDPASPDGKGIVGGALLGAELVLAVEAALDVQSTWAYVGGGLAGAAAGGVAGYFVEQETDTARIPMLMLAGGMALAIPTAVAVLSATAYEPPADYVQDRPPADEPVADPPQPTGTPAARPTGAVRRQRGERREVARRATPPALFDVSPEQVAISLPAVELREVFTRKEIATLGVSQATEVRIPVVSVLF